MNYLKVKGFLREFKLNLESLSYVFGGGLNSAINFFNTIIIIELFGQEVFGTYLLLLGAVTFLVPCVCLDVYRFIDKEAQCFKKNFIGMQLAITLTFVSLIAALIWFFEPTIFGMSRYQLLFLVAAAGLNSFNLAMFVIFKNKKKYVVHSFGEFLRFASITVLTVLIYYFEFDANWLAISILFFSYSIVTIFLVINFIIQSGKIKWFSSDEFSEAVFYSIPYTPYSFANFVNSQLDKYMLAIFFDVSTVGMYGFIVQLLSPIKVLSNALSKRFSRLYYTEKITDEKYVDFRYRYLSLISMFSFSNFTIVAIYFAFKGELNFDVYIVCFIFIITFFARSYKQLLMVLNSKDGKSLYASYDFIIVTMSSVIASLLLIPDLGQIGAALSVALSILFSCLFFHLILKK
jgi:O-antigen/teichoic acid export membrane protein